MFGESSSLVRCTEDDFTCHRLGVKDGKMNADCRKNGHGGSDATEPVADDSVQGCR